MLLVKSSYYSYLLPCIQTSIYFAPKGVTSPAEMWTCTKAFLPIVYHLSQYSSSGPGPWPRGAETSSQSLVGFTAGTHVCLPITQCKGE